MSGVEGEIDLKVTLGAIEEHLADGRRKQAFAYSSFRTQAPPTFTATGSPSVLYLGTPNMGLWWLIRQVRVTGVTIAAAPNINADLYVTAQPPSANPGVPPVTDWRGSSGTSASPSGLPQAYSPGTREQPVQHGEHVVIVVSGSGVTNGLQLQASLTVEEFRAFAGLVRTGESGA